jgi:D-amino-acid dehydrogenase
MSGSSKSIVIIGGGVIGLSVAYYAQRRGHRVTIIERGARDHDSCSRGNCGMVVPSHFIPLAAPGMVGLGLRMMCNSESPFTIRAWPSWDLLMWTLRFARAANAAHVARAAPLLRDLSLASRSAFEELAETPGADFDLVKRGLFVLCRTGHRLKEESATAAAAHRFGLNAEVLTPDETARLDPGVRFDIAGAVYFPMDCHLCPDRFVDTLTRELERGGAKFIWSAPFLGERFENQRLVAIKAGHGELMADEFVLAGGVWSATIARQLSVTIPMQPGKGYTLTLPHPPKQPTICSILAEARVAVTPMGERLRVGGTMEIGAWDQTIHAPRVRGILKALQQYYPDFEPQQFRDVPVWSGLRPVSADGLPFIGRSRKFTNLSIATGHGMLGLSLAPITGKLMAEILSDETPSIPIALLDPDRYAR